MGLFELGILPYYLHLLDKVSGAEHFLVSDEDARRLHRALQKPKRNPCLC
jgi:L-lysine 2,3-aminomutase